MKLQCGMNGVPRWFGEKNQRPKPKTGEQKKQNFSSTPTLLAWDICLAFSPSYVEDEDASHGRSAVLGQLC